MNNKPWKGALLLPSADRKKKNESWFQCCWPVRDKDSENVSSNAHGPDLMAPSKTAPNAQVKLFFLNGTCSFTVVWVQPAPKWRPCNLHPRAVGGVRPLTMSWCQCFKPCLVFLKLHSAGARGSVFRKIADQSEWKHPMARSPARL